MICRLRIRDFAIIDLLDIEFTGGFNVLTGETGAGKSIIIDAIGLLLGARASQEFIRTGRQTASIEGEFDISLNESAKDILGENGWEKTGTLLIGREISKSGKSQAFLNGRMVPVSMLQSMGSVLVDIHGQHDHQSLYSTRVQREFIDQFGGLEDLVNTVAETCAKYRRFQRELSDLEQSRMERTRQIDLIQYQLAEIDKAEISDPDEFEQLTLERNRLIHAEKLATASLQAYQELFDGDGSISDHIAGLQLLLKDLAQYDPAPGEWATKLEELNYQLREIAGSCRAYHESLEFDPDRIEYVETRIDVLKTLQKKYGPELSDVLVFYENMRNELERMKSLEEDSHHLRTRLVAAGNDLVETSVRLSRERKKIAKTLEKNVESLLAKLGMPKARFVIDFEPAPDAKHDHEQFISEQFRTHGFDVIEFRITPNPGESVKPLNKIASGGEISRIMLALKNLLAAHDRIPVMIFDEIDQGIGGPTAEIVGQVLKSVAAQRQVLCITHHAQIAFQAYTHFHVEKITGDRKTSVRIRNLDHAERVEELARMMGGIEPSAEISTYARQLLHQSQSGKT